VIPPAALLAGFSMSKRDDRGADGRFKNTHHVWGPFWTHPRHLARQLQRCYWGLGRPITGGLRDLGTVSTAVQSVEVMVVTSVCQTEGMRFTGEQAVN
jgi:hypothetical protein